MKILAPLTLLCMLGLPAAAATAAGQDDPASRPLPPCPPPGGDQNAPPSPPPDGGDAPPPPSDGEQPPPCPPADGKGPPVAGHGQPPGHSQAYKLAGAYHVTDTRDTIEDGRRYAASRKDESAIWVQGGRLSLRQPQVDKTGDSSSHENSSFHGLNAALLITGGGSLTVQGGQVQAKGLGANAVSAVDAGSVAELSDTSIVARGDGAHGVDAANGGRIVLHRVSIETFDASAAAVATDRGGGTIVVDGGQLAAHGYRSPGLYSTGTIKVTGANVRATGAEAAVIEGSNSIEVDNSQLIAGKSWGALLYQSFSGDAQGSHSRFIQHGGTFEASDGPLFYITNATGEITLEHVRLRVASGVLVKASDGQWGKSGRNGGHAVLHAVNQQLPGDLLAEHGGSVSAELTNGSALDGRVSGVALDIDASSHWNVHGDSTVTTLTLAGKDVSAKLARLRGNGYTVSYDAKAAANAWLGGKRWDLPGGGTLQPSS